VEEAKRLVKNGGDLTERAAPLKIHVNTKKIDRMTRWITNFADESCDRLPINDKGGLVQFVIPFLTVSEFFGEYEADSEENVGCAKTFSRAFNDMPHIRTMRCKGNFSTCAICKDHIKKQEFELQRNYLLLQSRQATFTRDIGKPFRSRIAKSTSRKVSLASHRANMRHIVECTRKGSRTTNVFLTVGLVSTKKLGHGQEWYHKLNWAAFVVDWKTITRFCEVGDPSRHSIDLLHGRLL
jgi:hypothetical protein